MSDAIVELALTADGVTSRAAVSQVSRGVAHPSSVARRRLTAANPGPASS